jgi:hypothetical protein
VKVNPRFKKIQDTVAWYDKNRKLTNKSTSMADFLKERAEVKTRADALEKEEESKNLTIRTLEENKDKVSQEKFEDFAKTLRADPVVEESVLILKDMLKS